MDSHAAQVAVICADGGRDRTYDFPEVSSNQDVHFLNAKRDAIPVRNSVGECSGCVGTSIALESCGQTPCDCFGVNRSSGANLDITSGHVE